MYKDNGYKDQQKVCFINIKIIVIFNHNVCSFIFAKRWRKEMDYRNQIFKMINTQICKIFLMKRM